MIPLIAVFLRRHRLIPAFKLPLLVRFEVHDQIGVLLASEHGRRGGVGDELEVVGGLPLGGEGSVAVDEAVCEDGVAGGVADGIAARVLRLESCEIRIVYDMVQTVGLVGFVHALDGVGDVHGVGPGVLLLDVCNLDAWGGVEGAGEESGGDGRRGQTSCTHRCGSFLVFCDTCLPVWNAPRHEKGALHASRVIQETHVNTERADTHRPLHLATLLRSYFFLNFKRGANNTNVRPRSVDA